MRRRTWGGLIGYSTDAKLIDGGIITMPDYRIYDLHGNWIVENAGVVPDTIIELKPTEVAKGYDAQLMKGVDVLQKKIAEEPRPWPKHEAYPVQKQ